MVAPRRSSRRSGFAVVEVMIALALFSVAIAAIYSLQIVTIASLSEARQLTDATFLAERVMERYRQESTVWVTPQRPAALAADVGSWVSLFDGQPVNKDGLQSAELANVISRPPRYCVKSRVVPMPSLGEDVLRVEVRVMWPRQDGPVVRYANCPETMDAVEHIPYTRQITLASSVYRHGGG